MMADGSNRRHGGGLRELTDEIVTGMREPNRIPADPVTGGEHGL
jgi:hypothetical protein